MTQKGRWRAYSTLRRTLSGLRSLVFAAEMVIHQAEVIHKLLGGLARGEAARTWSAVTELVNAMTVAMAV